MIIVNLWLLTIKFRQIRLLLLKVQKVEYEHITEIQLGDLYRRSRYQHQANQILSMETVHRQLLHMLLLHIVLLQIYLPLVEDGHTIGTQLEDSVRSELYYE
jgi:hypothetical protein